MNRTSHLCNVVMVANSQYFCKPNCPTKWLYIKPKGKKSAKEIVRCERKYFWSKTRIMILA